MRVSRVQAEENRQKVIDVASRLFREHGFDGIGLKDLMEGAGLTHGAFYKQFASKDDLGGAGLQTRYGERLPPVVSAAAANPRDPLGAVIAFYLSMEHRANRMDGCPVVALGADAARQGAEVKASFEAGITGYLEMLDGWLGKADGEEPSGEGIAILSTMVGAVILSRAVYDERLSKQFLQAATDAVRMKLSAGDARQGPVQ